MGATEEIQKKFQSGERIVTITTSAWSFYIDKTIQSHTNYAKLYGYELKNVAVAPRQTSIFAGFSITMIFEKTGKGLIEKEKEKKDVVSKWEEQYKKDFGL